MFVAIIFVPVLCNFFLDEFFRVTLLTFRPQKLDKQVKPFDHYKSLSVQVTKAVETN